MRLSKIHQSWLDEESRTVTSSAAVMVAVKNSSALLYSS